MINTLLYNRLALLRFNNTNQTVNERVNSSQDSLDSGWNKSLQLNLLFINSDSDREENKLKSQVNLCNLKI